MPKLQFDLMVIWLDQDATLRDYYIRFKKLLLSITNPEDKSVICMDEKDIPNSIRDGSTSGDTTILRVPIIFQFFSEIDPCFQCLLKYAGKAKIFFITSGSLGKDILPQIFPNHQQIFQDKNGKIYEDSIYIFCADTEHHSLWARHYLDNYGCIKMQDNDRYLLACLARDIAKYFISQGEELAESNQIEILNDAKKYFIWARGLYDKADSADRISDTLKYFNDIDKNISRIEQKIKQLTNQDDEISLSQEN